MLSTGQESDSWGGILTHELWGDILTHALPQLEQLLLSPLREVVQHCRVLYLVPDSQLYFVPFAALTFADGTALIDHCALATVPSATILKWCRSRRPNQPRRDLLALGVGEASDKNTRTIAFAEYAQAIAQAINALGVTETKLLPETTTAKQLLAEARHCTILHLACHGTIDETNLDMLAASSLMLADQLTARDVFNTQLSTELVFLNACMSGGFRLRISGEVGGFWQAFLHAGTASLIATLFYVHPDSAQQLALAFYKEWLKGGVTKAEALRRAQRQLRQQCAELSWWASHILIGDHR
jgi:CHAT domain-containing protein